MVIDNSLQFGLILYVTEINWHGVLNSKKTQILGCDYGMRMGYWDKFKSLTIIFLKLFII